MKYAILEVLSLIGVIFCLSACGKAPPNTNITFSDEVFPYTNPSVPQVGKRLIYLHGIGGSHIQMTDTPDYKVVIDILANAGWQVILIDLPIPNSHMFDDEGYSYRDKYAAKLAQTLKWSEENVGHCTVNVIGGASFGGLHSFMGAAINPDINGYFGDVPVTLVETLPADFHPAHYFSPFEELATLSTKKGYISYGEQDIRTNWHLANALVQVLPANMITSVDYPSMGHDVHDLTPIANWVLSTF